MENENEKLIARAQLKIQSIIRDAMGPMAYASL